MNTHRQLVLLAIALLLAGCSHSQPVSSNADGASGDEQSSGSVQLDLNITSPILQAFESQLESALDLDDVVQVAVQRPREVFRRIEPGEIPDAGSLGNVEYADGSWNIRGLPADKALLIQIAFQPNVDLASGEPFSTDNPERTYAVYIPVPDTTDSLVNIDADIQISEHDDAYRGDVQATITVGEESTILATQLDYAAGLVSRDSDNDGDFCDEAWLADEARIGISARQVARLADANATDTDQTEPVTVAGSIDILDECGGKLTLTDVELLSETGGRQHLDTLELKFAEDTPFILRQIDTCGEKAISSPPDSLTKVQPVTIRTDVLVSHLDAATEAYWVEAVEELKLDLPADCVAVVPLRLEAEPGTAVPVTVYANQTANPLHAIDNIRVAFELSNEYETASFNAGDRGGSPSLPDGIWTGIDTDSVNLTIAHKTAAASSSEAEESVVDVQLLPVSGEDMNEATGALFNFNLICHTDALPEVILIENDETASLFSDTSKNSYTWRSAAAVNSGVQVAGNPMVLELVDPPAAGDGLIHSPYLVTAGTHFQLRLIHPVDGNVTSHPKARYEVTSQDDKLVYIDGSVLHIERGYAGKIALKAYYKDRYSDSTRNPYIFVDKIDGFEFVVHEAQTYIFGGSAEGWDLEIYPRNAGVVVEVAVRGAENLHALFGELHFDPALYLPESSNPNQSTGGEQGYLSIPAGVSTFRIGAGITEYGQVLINPQLTEGFTGEGTIASFEFTRCSNTCEITEPFVPLTACAAVTWAGADSSLVWSYHLPGDYNQDGLVYSTTPDGPAYTDLTMLCVYFGSTGEYTPGDIEYVVDTADADNKILGSDGHIFLEELIVIFQNYGQHLQGWNVYGGDSGDYPNGGSLSDYVPFTAYRGDPLAEQIWFSWTPAEAASGSMFWLKPVLDDEEGPASEPVMVP